MAFDLCIEHDVAWGGLLYWGLEALEATEDNLEEESEKVALFHTDFITVSEARRRTHRVDSTIKRVQVQDAQCGTSAPLLEW